MNVNAPLVSICIYRKHFMQVIYIKFLIVVFSMILPLTLAHLMNLDSDSNLFSSVLLSSFLLK